jgi:hypothetical protein
MTLPRSACHSDKWGALLVYFIETFEKWFAAAEKNYFASEMFMLHDD